MSSFGVQSILASAASAHPSRAIEPTATAVSHGEPDIPLTPAAASRIQLSRHLDDAAEFVKGNPLLAFALFLAGSFVAVRLRARFA